MGWGGVGWRGKGRNKVGQDRLGATGSPPTTPQQGVAAITPKVQVNVQVKYTYACTHDDARRLLDVC